jgi:hypothetical protein
MQQTIKFRHFGPYDPDLGKAPELPGLSPAELQDRGKKSIAALRREAAAGWRAGAAANAAPATAEIWAAWAIRTRFGFEPNGNAKVFIEPDTHMAQFHRSGEPIGPAVFVPEHCRTVKRADLWHLMHQAGAPAEVRERLANPYGRLEPELQAALAPATGLKGEEALAALVDAPARLLAAYEAMLARWNAQRIAYEAEARARAIVEFPAEEARALAEDGGDGSALAGRGDGFWPVASTAQWRRNEWWKLAKEAHEYGLTEARDRCVARARLFHRLFLQFRREEEAAAIAAEAARIAALPPPPTKEEKRAIAAARKADKAARSAAFQAKKAAREAQRAHWRAVYASWYQPSVAA